MVILAGGLGTRLRAVLPDRPKSLAPVGPRPFLEIELELLRDQGARRFVLCVGHLADQVQEHFGDGAGWSVRIDYSVERGPLLGTGGALKLAQRFFTPRALVLNGDTFFAIDYAGLIERHVEERARCGALATVALARASETARYGSVLLDASGQYLAEFAEKRPDDVAATVGQADSATHGRQAGSGARWLNAGAYVIERELLEALPDATPCSLEREVFPGVLASGRRLAAWTSSRRFFDIGTPEGLRAFTEYDAEYHDDRRH